jgi:hypothetical protein
MSPPISTRQRSSPNPGPQVGRGAFPELVCGDIKLSAALTRPPGAGVGTAPRGGSFPLSVALIVLALLLASAGGRLAWRGRHG